MCCTNAWTELASDLLTPAWKFLFGGCMLNRETDKWTLESFEWSDSQGAQSIRLSD